MFYLDLFRSLQHHRVDYLLVGGLAMNLHGVPRMTMDIDLMLSMDSRNFARFLDCAAELGLVPLAPVALSELGSDERRRDWAENKHMVAFGLQAPAHNAPLVDILIAPPIDCIAAIRRGEYRQIGDVLVRLASIDDMIALKTAAGRRQDLADIEHLERLRD